MPRQCGVTESPSPQAAFDQAKAQFLCGLACHEAGDFVQAEQHYHSSLRLLPDRPSTLINLAATQLRLGHAADALASADARHPLACAVDPREA